MDNLRQVVNELKKGNSVSYSLEIGNPKNVEGFSVTDWESIGYIYGKDLDKNVKEAIVKAEGKYQYMYMVPNSDSLMYMKKDIVPRLRDAIILGMNRGLEYIFTNGDKVRIELPEPQRSGTTTQQMAYTRQVAERIEKEYLTKNN